jgi:hypothetical protein
MNPNNYATLEAAQRLLDAGIVLKADAYYGTYYNSKISNLYTAEEKNTDYNGLKVYIPAPSMAEVWRELPDTIRIDEDGDAEIYFFKSGKTHYVNYQYDDHDVHVEKSNTNPTDALIDLLIWVKTQKEGV